MDEVFAILIAVGAMLVGIWAMGWAYGDFQKPHKEGQG